ncbi:YceI family protein [Hyphococcus flavus]|uniref:YceI family protein n=1 Tax=Hyphococcus flavus TaxID=1866326 RepID=A0AAF0CFQ5_9PROT|nr:YceI family protein [Hyphococcus flavus]WDI31288.1 YceI family protein [Hyphococcus flavus]
MRVNMIAASTAAALVVAGCGQAANGQSGGSEQPASGVSEAADFGAPSGEYRSEERHRYITFSYMHQGYSRPWVRWRDWDAVLDWDAENPEDSSLSVTIDATSVDSGVDVFDGHLQGERFFDTANHPEITFESTSLNRMSDTEGTMTGDLTIKGVSKPVTLDVQFNKGAYEERSNVYKLGFSAIGTVKRSEFGMTYAIPAVSDEVEIIIESEFTMPADE